MQNLLHGSSDGGGNNGGGGGGNGGGGGGGRLSYEQQGAKKGAGPGKVCKLWGHRECVVGSGRVKDIPMQ